MIKVAMLSKWHVHASDYAKQVNEHPELAIKLVWDENADRGRAWADELGVAFVESLDEVLSHPEIDAVVIDTPTSMHREVMLKAIEAKKHIFSEKVLALTVEDCDTILKQADEQGISFMLSLPRLSEPFYLYAQQAVDEGWLGNVTTLRCRMAHNGSVPGKGQTTGWLPAHFYDAATCGGGALIDLGAHPIYLSNRLAGPATSVSAQMSRLYASEVEDQAVVTLDYGNGAIGILETGFVSYGSPFSLELYGTEGALLIRDGDIKLISAGKTNGEWASVTNDLPQKGRMPIEQWVDMILRGTEPDITSKDMIELTKLNEAAYTANSAQKKVGVSL
ncbi:Gfo/Idh/MocA family protein [Aureibacillus halotolerans]|uniref:Putative dehydrogenase n=1 Tax=Aureibacillus halotolerans TaxID=1508390 RepID=A0A4R6TXZ0_9BACI|nr:Gfo/Idh/MocA family oxidoreductase [Aureibacillus halotolerans]TDQ36755.1 putative dehydrogenase [Aureibacillus halotolerans]